MTKPQNRSHNRVLGWLSQLINVWHKQSYPKKIKATYDLGAMEDLSIENLPAHGTSKCHSETGRIASASRSNVPYVREY